MRVRLYLAGFAIFSVGLMPASAQQSAPDTIVVLDASGSMHGRVDGRPKIEIARETLSSVLSELPSGMRVGMIAYGHRERGSCGDIETVVPVAPANQSVKRIVDAAYAIQPKGKTPLSEAVRKAAEELKYTENAANVILVTDGVETCNADPCALGRELEGAGIGFTTHVIGFGLSKDEGKQVACLAEETGGQYYAADNASALSEALRVTMAAATTPEPEPEPETVAEASLTFENQVPMGKRFTVTWEGPANRLDDVYIVDPNLDQGKGKRVGGQRLNQDKGYDRNEVTITAPATPGMYELRYWDGTARQDIAAAPLEVVDAEVSLDAPGSAGVEEVVTVNWRGPAGRRDDVQVFDPDAKGGSGAVVRSQRLSQDKGFDDGAVSLRMPKEPGRYELRYWNGDYSKVLATLPILVE
jgi:Ca-activated chloride channel family protein